MSLLSLPNEILLEISYVLSIIDQNSLLQVNRRLAYLLQYGLMDTVFRTQNKIYGQRALYFFASRNDATSVQALLDRGVLSFIGSSGTVLNKAIKRHTVTTLSTLLNCGMNAEVPDERGWTPLMLTILAKRLDMMQVLLSKTEYKVDINKTLQEHGTPLMIAAKIGFTDAVAMLLEHSDIEVNVTEPGGWSALQISINKKMVDILNLLLADSRVDISTLNGTFLTPLMCAVKSKDANIVQLLLQHPRLKIYPTARGNTPLHEAAKLDDTTILKMLLHDKRMDVNAVNVGQFTPLHVACFCCDEAIRVLLDDGRADINALSQYSSTPLHIAALCGTLAAVQMLLEDPRIDIHRQDIRRETALYIIMHRRAAAGTSRAIFYNQDGGESYTSS
ncbi:ankyrin repeat-containing domain protein [Tuber indicum]|nr:ankyrin repeat-containing domain protein [Tuber indicum]